MKFSLSPGDEGDLSTRRPAGLFTFVHRNSNQEPMAQCIQSCTAEPGPKIAKTTPCKVKKAPAQQGTEPARVKE